MIKLVIFDLDGTLIDAYRAIEKSLNFTLRSLGYKEVSYDQVRRAVGRGVRNFIAQFVKTADISKGLTLYRKHHQGALQRYSTLQPYARKVLSALRHQGIKLAVASNRPTKFSQVLIQHLGLGKYFDYVTCADKKHELKPEPYLLLKVIKKLKVDKNEALYVGDMCFDVQAANNAKVRAVAIVGGSSSRKELAALKPYKIIDNLSQLLKIR